MANDQEKLLKLVDEKMDQALTLLEKCQILIDKKIEGSMKFKRKVQAEFDFLSQLKQRPNRLRPNHVTGTNLTHLNALCEAALNEEGVVAVLAPFQRMDDKQSNLLVDIVADGGFTWVKVVARSARGLHFAWAGEASYQERGIVDQADDYVSTARKNPHLYKSPKVIFLFCAGVTQPIVDDLKRRFHVESKGDIVAVDPGWGFPENDENDEEDESDDDEESEEDDEEDTALSQIQHPASNISSPSPDDSIDSPLNLDITALIAYVSALTNGDGAQYRFKEPLLDEQATWERERPALPRLKKLMDPDVVGRKMICCKMAYNSFMDILTTVGGDGEKQRADALLKRVEIVEDRLSERMEKLQSGGKIKERSKIIFGSGDFYHAITVTANRGFYHAAANQGVRLAIFFHESRALSEQKQQHAIPLSES